MEPETLEVDILFVGAGPAGLSGAIRLARLVDERSLGARTIMVLEKGDPVGAHGISGCILDPRALREFIPDFLERGAPLEGPVTGEEVLFLTRRHRIRGPFTPPPLRNDGCYVVSLGKLVRWLAAQAEALGVDVYPGFPAAEVLYEDGRVAGVRTGAKGVDREGRPKANYEPPMDVRARVTVFCEGPRGSCAKQLIGRLGLDAGRHPQNYSTGVKEVWRVPGGRCPAGHVVHTMGYPLDGATFGGGFVYGMAEDHVSVGLVVGLDYQDPHLDVHEAFQRFKMHPWLAAILEGGEVVSYGAKAIPEGGYYAMPRLWGDGFLLAGDSGGFLNSMRLKGVHLAMKSGAMAAEACAEALAADRYDGGQLRRHEDLFQASWAREELWKVRNFHQGMQRGLWLGLVHAGLQMATGGRGLFDPMTPRFTDHGALRKVDRAGAPPERARFDDRLTFDKLKDVYFSGTTHEEDQPVHLRVADTGVCVERCTREFGNPCEHFCPARVYEMVQENGSRRLQINASNCVHCKTCDIKDPYQIITWVTPEGGGGPQYARL
ncbi:MAG: electron transfer flavoprotein-ubiquinone oxidoreductase [Planctomycetes bacterium]|nr:electron transfer flavoprotein-ubiquinone oxidoreductase [Planctomycetota bacterium]